MQRRARLDVVMSLLLTTSACQHRVSTWRDVAQASGCTPALLASATPYDSSRVRELTGSYRLVQVDTARGWVETEVQHSSPAAGRPLRLWVADSVVAHFRPRLFTGTLIPAKRPVIGAVTGYGESGFTDMNPQVEIGGAALNELTVAYHARPVLDGVAPWRFPVERVGPWGFGGYFDQGADWITPFGIDGKPLPPRSGYYCALRV